jgi:hypothetical protein
VKSEAIAMCIVVIPVSKAPYEKGIIRKRRRRDTYM